MILNSTNLTLRLSVDKQNAEIERLQNAKAGAAVFTVWTFENSDVIDTLLYKSGTRYHIGVGDGKATYYKEA